MIIKNFNELVTNRKKKHALSIIESGLNAAVSDKIFKKIITAGVITLGHRRYDLKKYSRVFVIATGKAAYFMTNSINSRIKLDGGIIVVPRGSPIGHVRKKFIVMKTGHPVPNNASVLAAQKIVDFLKKTKPADFILFLVSGGTSSLVALPDGISLGQKQTVTNLLLKSGADIHEINCIRKHLSKIKGGRLLDNLNCDAVSLIMSDVVDDDLSSIGSGMIYCDMSTFSDALKIIRKYNLDKIIPKKVLKRLHYGARGVIKETPKKQRIKNFIVSSNHDCLVSMISTAKKLGYSPMVLKRVSGNVVDVSKKISLLVIKNKLNCIIFGGETTVRVTGSGKGGRNQELVLRIISELNKFRKRRLVVCVGTDGIDGNTNAAGAIAESNFPSELVIPFLKRNDSYGFFKKHKGLIFTGQTQVNLMDIGLILS